MLDKAIDTLDVFDGTQFKHVIDHGYRFETNHAFMPLFSYLISTLSKVSGFDTDHTAMVYQTVMHYLTSLILYQ